MRGWARRTAEVHGELGEVAELGGDPRWWLVAGGVALASRGLRHAYVASDAEPLADTFIGYPVATPLDPIADAIARAHAARAAIRALDGELPDQPLAVTIRRTPLGAVVEPSALDVAVFAIGDRCWCAVLAASPADEHALAADLAAAIAGRTPRTLQPLGALATPFVTVTLGDEPLATARHGHRRGWLDLADATTGPWLGLSRAHGLALVSTCHLAVDGFGHTWLASRIAGTVSKLSTCAPAQLTTLTPSPVKGAVSLGVAWRRIEGRTPTAIQLGYGLGRLLHGIAGESDARFSPTFQIPVAPGAPADPMRRRRRVVPAIASVRFEGGAPEPFERFSTRTREMLARESAGSGLAARLLAAAQRAPAPLAWKRRALGAGRPRWLESVAGLVGGRGCISKIRLDVPELDVPACCAVSSPARAATDADPIGGCVVTVIEGAAGAAITFCGSGSAGTHAAAETLLDRLLELVR